MSLHDALQGWLMVNVVIVVIATWSTIAWAGLNKRKHVAIMDEYWEEEAARKVRLHHLEQADLMISEVYEIVASGGTVREDAA